MSYHYYYYYYNPIWWGCAIPFIWSIISFNPHSNTMKQNPNCSHFTDEENWGQNGSHSWQMLRLKFTLCLWSPAHTFCSPLLTFLGQGNQLDHFVFCPKNRLERKNGCSRQRGPGGSQNLSCHMLLCWAWGAEVWDEGWKSGEAERADLGGRGSEDSRWTRWRGVCPQGPRPRWSRPWGDHEVLPTWPRPLWEEPTVLSYHHRGKAYGGNQAQPLSWPLGLVPPCSANLAKGLIWEGALSQAAGPCPPRAHTQVSPESSYSRGGELGKRESWGQRREEGRVPGSGALVAQACWLGREGLQSGSVSGREEREGWGVSGGQPWGLRSHTVLHGGVECGGVGNKPERRNKRWASVWSSSQVSPGSDVLLLRRHRLDNRAEWVPAAWRHSWEWTHPQTRGWESFSGSFSCSNSWFQRFLWINAVSTTMSVVAEEHLSCNV